MYHPNNLEIMLEAMLTNDCDIVECKSLRFNKTAEITPPSGNILISNNLEIIRRFGSRELEIALWSKIFRKELFANFNFPKGELYEEPYFYFHIYKRLNKVAFLSHKLYFYRDSPGSIMKSLNSSSVKSNIRIHRFYIKQLKTLKDYPDIVQQRVLKDILSLWIRVLYSNLNYHILKEIDKNIEDICKFEYSTACFSLKEKYIIRFHNNYVFKKLLRLVHKVRSK